MPQSGQQQVTPETGIPPAGVSASRTTFVPRLKFPAPHLRDPAAGLYRNLYGSDYIAARYCGFDKPPKETTGVWVHGWYPSNRNLVYPEQLFGATISHLKTERYWVATKGQEGFLHSQGFPHARAIGLPIIYTADNRIERRKGSLLVMPVHSLGETKHKWDAESYVRTITNVRKHFQEIIICVSAHCWKNGHWVSEFQAGGFKVVQGADGADPWTLQKMRDLFGEFEFVTTNGFGSQLAYAACFGAKVCIFGNYAETSAEALSNVPFYRDNPHLLNLALQYVCEGTIRRRFPELFCHPADAQSREAWGRAELGCDNKVSPREMKELFGWTFTGRARARIGNGVRKAKALLPTTVKRELKSMLKTMRSPQVRQENRERRRLERLPRYTPGQTQLFGRTIEFIDACTYLEMLKELFERQLYRFAANSPKPLVIDGGANIGLSVLYFKCLYPDSKVIAFEADPAIFEVLQRNCQTYELDDVQLVPKALWKCETILSFQPEGSLAGRISQAPQTPKTVSVHTCRLRDYLQQPVALLKLDIEGAETEVLRDCADLLKNVAHVFVEHHSFLNRAQDLHTVINLLHDSGFRMFVEPAAPARQPLFARTIICGMDVQTNIFGFRV